MRSAKPANSGSTTESGRKVGKMRTLPRLPARVANGLVIGERIERRIGGGQHLKVELLKKRAGQKLRRAQLVGDGVEIEVGGFFRKPLLEAEELLKGVVEPDARGRAAEQIVVAGEDVPDPARVLDHRLPDLQIVHGNALAVQHAEDVVIGLHEERGGIGKRLRCGRTSLPACGREG